MRQTKMESIQLHRGPLRRPEGLAPRRNPRRPMPDRFLSAIAEGAALILYLVDLNTRRFTVPY
jgi:hypothetical protein